MPKPLPEELKKQIYDAMAVGTATAPSVAARFGVSVTTVRNVAYGIDPSLRKLLRVEPHPIYLSTKYIKQTLIPSMERIRDIYGKANEKERGPNLQMPKEDLANIMPMIACLKEVLRSRGVKC